MKGPFSFQTAKQWDVHIRLKFSIPKADLNIPTVLAAHHHHFGCFRNLEHYQWCGQNKMTDPLYLESQVWEEAWDIPQIIKKTQKKHSDAWRGPKGEPGRHRWVWLGGGEKEWQMLFCLLFCFQSLATLCTKATVTPLFSPSISEHFRVLGVSMAGPPSWTCSILCRSHLK